MPYSTGLNSLFCVLYAGSAVPVGKELVPRTVLTDSALCQKRPIHSSGRNMGGNGRPGHTMHLYFTDFNALVISAARVLDRRHSLLNFIHVKAYLLDINDMSQLYKKCYL